MKPQFVIGVLCLLSTVAGLCIDTCEDGACFDPPNECRQCAAGKGLEYDRQGCIDCPDFCGECYQDIYLKTVCKYCRTGYFLLDNRCLACPEFCSRCEIEKSTRELVCLECYDTANPVYINREIRDKCLPCPSNCKVCTEDPDNKYSTLCSSCFDGYYKTSAGQCSQCSVSNCRRCSSDGSFCTTCEKGFNINSDGSKCLTCDSTSCASCINEANTGRSGFAKCTSCKEGYAQEDDACPACQGTSCVKCSPDPFTCTACSEGYRVDSGSCIECGYQCNLCKDSQGDSECTECKTNFGLKSDIHSSCDACPDKCDACNANGQCTKCTTKTASDDKFVCQNCPSKCDTCTFDNTLRRTKCKSSGCESGYVYRPADGTCHQCPANCATCYYNSTSDQPECSQCTIQGFIVSEEDSTSCLACPDNCRSCIFNDTLGVSDCYNIECETGYIDVNDASQGGRTICEECPQGSDECETCNSTHCLTCKPGYMLDSTYWACDGCPKDCKTCYTTTIIVTVTEKPKGKKKKPVEVQVPQTTQYCSVCDDLFALRGDDGACEACPTHCSECKWSATLSQIVCDTGKCDTKYALDSSFGNCYKCPNWCDECTFDVQTRKTVCNADKCSAGYTQNEDSSCEKCPAHCTDCIWEDGKAKCKDNKCEGGFGRTSDQTCSACPSGCDTCTLSETDNTLLVCSTCLTGYRKNEVYCGACPLYCTKCTDNKGTMMCSECENKYTLRATDNVCLPCPTNCNECKYTGSMVQCTACKEGFGKSEAGFCQTCEELTLVNNCANCTGYSEEGAKCLSCPSGYTFRDDGLKCLPCNFIDGCLACKDLSHENSDGMGRCKQCKKGYTRTLDYMCAHLCYSCTEGDQDYVSEDLCKTVNETVSPVVECVIGTCWSYRREKSSKVEILRGCFNDTGNSCEDEYTEESCNEVEGIKICSRCCDDNHCNTFELTGMPASSAIITYSAISLCVAVLSIFM